MNATKKAGFLATTALLFPLTLGAQDRIVGIDSKVTDLGNYSREELFRQDEGNLRGKLGNGLQQKVNLAADNGFEKKKEQKKRKPFYKSWEFWAWQVGMNINSARAIESKYKRAFRECGQCRDEIKIPNFPVGKAEKYAVNLSIDTAIDVGSHFLRGRKSRVLRIMGRVLPSLRIAQTSAEAYINNRISDGYNRETARQRALYGQQNN